MPSAALNTSPKLVSALSSLESSRASDYRSPSASSWTAPSSDRAHQFPSSPSPGLPQSALLPPYDDRAGSPRSPFERQTITTATTPAADSSSACFTAAWASPYASPRSQTSPRCTSTTISAYHTVQESPDTLKDQTEQGARKSEAGSSLSSTEESSYASERFNRAIASAALDTSSVASREARTARIRQYLSGQSYTERGNWWSDDSLDSSDSLPIEEEYCEDKSDTESSWFGLGPASQDEDFPEEPTLSSFLKRRESKRKQESACATPKSLKSKESSTSTPKQADFWETFTGDLDKTPRKNREMFGSIFADPPPKPDLGRQVHKSLAASIFADRRRSSRQESKEAESKHSAGFLDAAHPNNASEERRPSFDKPLPPPPPPAAVAAAVAAAPLAKETPDSEVARKPLAPAETSQKPRPVASATSVQRHKKKVIWRKKACIIALPLEDNRGAGDSRGHLLTPADVEASLQSWKQRGFDIRGFTLGVAGNHFDATEADGRSRPAYPDVDDLRRERETTKPRVFVPNQQEWDSYVNLLNEEKLRSLGVDFGNEPAVSSLTPVSITSIPQIFSQSQGLSVSPPLPTASRTSTHGLSQPNQFSPQFGLSTNASSHVGSIASPASQFGIPGALHMPKVSMSYGFNQKSFASPFQTQAPTPPMPVLSPLHYVESQDGSRGTTPFLHATHPSVAPTLGSTPEYPTSIITPSLSNDKVELLVRMRQQQLQLQLMEQQQMQMNQLNQQRFPVVDEGKVTEVKDRFSMDYHAPEIAQPVPRIHRHNVSDTLQKGIDTAPRVEDDGVVRVQETVKDKAVHQEVTDSHYHLEEALRRQLDEEDEKSRDAANSYDLVGSFQSSQHHTGNKDDGIVKDDGKEGEVSDMVTNPSASNSPAFKDAFEFPKEQRKLSTALNTWTDSKINESNPTLPTNSHHSKPSFSKLNVEAKEFRFEPKESANSSTLSNDVKQSKGFNVSAPTFMPSVYSQATLPSSDFNFKGPTLQTLGTNLNSAGVPNASPVFGTQNIKSNIFGDIEFAQIVKPVKVSKAIPIVHPEDVPKREKMTDNDQKGNERHQQPIAEATTPSKRARRESSDGEREPQFALPPPVPDALKPQQVPEIARPKSSGHEKRKIGPVPGTSSDNLAGIPSPLVAEFEREEEEEDVVKVIVPSPRKWSPFEFENSSGMENFSGSRPPPSPAEHKRQNQAMDKDHMQMANFVLSEKNKKTLAEKSDGKLRSSPSLMLPLSAAAPPFIFKATETTASSISTEVPPNNHHRTPAATLPTGLESSRFADSLLATSTIKNNSSIPNVVINNAGSSITKRTSLNSNSKYDDSLAEPTYDEIDAVMKHLNGENSDAEEAKGLRNENLPPVKANADSAPSKGSSQGLETQHDAPTSRKPTPSPVPRSNLSQTPLGRLRETDTDEALRFEFQSSIHRYQSPVHRLNRPEDVAVSDWDSMISPSEDEKLQQRTTWFDSRVDDIVGNVLDNRLGPIEQSLDSVREALELIAAQPTAGAMRRSVSTELGNSDADDEDDDDTELPSKSAWNRRERKAEAIKTAVIEAISTHQALLQPISRESEILEALAIQNAALKANRLQQAEIIEAVTSLRHLIPPSPSEAVSVRVDEDCIRAAVEDAVASQHLMKDDPVGRSRENANAEKLKLQITGLESMLKVTDERAQEETKKCRLVEQELSETKDLLRQARDDAAHQREFAEETEKSLRAFHDDRQQLLTQAQSRNSALEDQVNHFKKCVEDLNAKNVALEGTLEEYRKSSDQWRGEVTSMKMDNTDLTRTIQSLKQAIEESVNARKILRSKFDKLQEDMTIAARNIAEDQARWRTKERDYQSRGDILKAQLDADGKAKERLELEVRSLKDQAREATMLRFSNERLQQENSKLQELAGQLRHETWDHQKHAAQLERDLLTTRESTKLEVQRTKALLEGDVEAARNQVNTAKAQYESEATLLRTKLDKMKLDADAAKTRHDMILEEAMTSKKNALQEAAEARDAAVQEHLQSYQRIFEEVKARNARALQNVTEDKLRMESDLRERLKLADDKNAHLQDKVIHLEEKLKITQSAAMAAAKAAVSGRTTSPFPGIESMPGPASNAPEKISPQALRESIIVLQEQLHERETRIEKLETDLSQVDQQAPTKLKEKEVEVNWLRELLSVRLDDLRDIIETLSSSSYNKDAARDAAIRLKANLEMQQQVKEKNPTDNQAFPSLSNLTSFTSSPRAFPLAAAAAWRNWQKGRENKHSNNSDAASSGSQTPTRPLSSQGLLSGLLTPPSSSFKQVTPKSTNLVPLHSTPGSRPLRSLNSQPRPLRQQQVQQPQLVVPQPQRPQEDAKAESLLELPTTPPLLRKASYDQDAEARSFMASGFGSDDQSNDDSDDNSSSHISDISPTANPNPEPFEVSSPEATAVEGQIEI